MFLEDLPPQKRNRFKIISFLVLPALFIFGFYLSTKLSEIIFDHLVDIKGIIFVGVVLIVLYIRSVTILYRKLKQPEDL